MATRPSGWFDDPDDDTQLRYFDGVVWTEHTAAKRPAPPQDVVGPRPEPAAAQPPGQAAVLPPYPASNAGGPGSAGGAPWSSGAPGRRTAADGTPLSGWWRRVGAYLLDTFLTALITMPLVLGQLGRVNTGFEAWTSAVQRAIESGATMPQPSQDFLTDVATISLTHVIVYLAYELVFLCRLGATPGRMVVGILVRVVGGSGPLPFPAALRRTIVKRVSDLLAGLAVIGSIAFAFQVLDYLWPIRDPGAQALHDKVGRTEVVRGRPPRRRRADRS